MNKLFDDHHFLLFDFEFDRNLWFIFEARLPFAYFLQVIVPVVLQIVEIGVEFQGLVTFPLR